jgi:hypothetical protein
MEHLKLFILLVGLGLLNIHVFAQGICVPDTFEVNSVNGKVMAHLDRGDEPFPDVVIRITKKDKPKNIVKETKINDSGVFDFGDLKQGRYDLIASYPHLKDFYLDLLVTAKHASKNEQIIIWLAADFIKPCSGSYAELKEK